jgi:hypothetical protein
LRGILADTDRRCPIARVWSLEVGIRLHTDPEEGAR